MTDQRVPLQSGSTPPDGPDSSRPSYLGDDYRTPVDRVHSRVSPAVYRRRRLVVGVLALLLAVALVLVAGLVWPGFWRAEAEPEPLPTVTATAPAPTPTVQPMARAAEETAFQKALPSAVLAYALLSQAASEPTLDAGAVEAWTAVYGDGAQEITVVAGQWASPEDATAAADAFRAAAGEASAEGDVLVGEEVVGTYGITPGPTPDTSVVTWRNGTAVLQATGLADAMEAFYAAFPL
ncbi:hypothetical protein [Antribacter gilvus]|uniref:hypothetical protein n=1 Tax=Antribacter gilvus TaxID=2304675 RepID=UPI000F7856AF|nr:hypothetical protein [Antribacter gilvus]